MRVLAFSKWMKGNAALAAYRVVWPFGELNKQQDFDNCTVIGEQDVRRLIVQRQLQRVLGYDLYVLQRLLIPSEGAKGFIGTLRDTGAKVVFETDDDISDDYRELGYKPWVEATIGQCDAITVSTKHLGEVMARYKKPVYMLPNYLHTEWFGQVSLAAERVFDSLVIGLVGTRSHWGDWQLVLDALKIVKRKHPEVTIAVGGYRPPYLEDGIEGLKFFAPVPFEAYPALMRQFDILLCPLEADDKFNWSKSGIGALEPMAAARPINGKMGGAVPICSGDLPVYRRVVNNRHNGLLVKDGDWAAAIIQLVEDAPLRQRLAINGLRWVRKHRDIKLAGPRWGAAYRKILEG